MAITRRVKQKQASKSKATKQPVVYAGFWVRVGAKILDTLVLWVPFILLTSGLQLAVYGSPDNWPDDPHLFFMFLSGLFLITLGLYDIVAIKKYETTIGKKAMGLKVISANKEPSIGWGRAVLRKVVYHITTNLLFLYLGSLWIIWDKKKQGLHDKAAETYVVKAK